MNNLNININGVPEELKIDIKEFIVSIVDVVSRRIDLSDLDGITFAGDYHQALLDVDRGYDTEHKLTPSNDHGVGIAMSPRVLRDGRLKTHIVINAKAFLNLLQDKRSDLVINTFAHECAHVELNSLYEIAFPRTVLRLKENVLDKFRTDCMLACWDEFGACWRSASFGPSSPLCYEAAFLPALKETRQTANAAIMEYRSHANLFIVINKVCGLYGGLLRYSAYHLGNLHGHGIEWRAVTTTVDALNGHWFLPYFERLDVACKAIATDLGNWSSSTPFDLLKDIAEDLITEGGLHFSRHEDDRISLNIPMTVETMPVPPHLWR